ncbi:hypothetical protein A2160_02535 [Candidatus Beckwithbacteria bacterium RBG_13_42_9]|uniref:N-acetyltransferase domain-containing protein n=1 Tax=Candidatus Beckwithbacteria bacterium RBG_13_42_9 TaxID=1797457 RepID=A0A1F5E7J1_9BACT|nr:MAG: hypothetical protein A2160_02535 [Candidatus Beckwithbacteria bacterium RBG_13_42_9]
MKRQKWQQKLKAIEALIKAPLGYRLELINSSHTPFIIKWRNDSSINRFFFSQEKLTIKKQENFLKNYFSKDRIDFILTYQKEDLPIGSFSIKNVHTFPELGQLIGEKRFRGKGLAKKVTLALIDIAYDYLGLDSLWARIQKRNRINIHLHQKLGFLTVGEESFDNIDYLIMRLKKEDWLRFSSESKLK